MNIGNTLLFALPHEMEDVYEEFKTDFLKHNKGIEPMPTTEQVLQQGRRKIADRILKEDTGMTATQLIAKANQTLIAEQKAEQALLLAEQAEQKALQAAYIAEQAEQKAEQEKQKAEQEKQKAEQVIHLVEEEREKAYQALSRVVRLLYFDQKFSIEQILAITQQSEEMILQIINEGETPT